MERWFLDMFKWIVRITTRQVFWSDEHSTCASSENLVASLSSVFYRTYSGASFSMIITVLLTKLLQKYNSLSEFSLMSTLSFTNLAGVFVGVYPLTFKASNTNCLAKITARLVVPKYFLLPQMFSWFWFTLLTNIVLAHCKTAHYTHTSVPNVTWTCLAS